ncbi:MAG: hypothetical protein HQL41_12655, partial [Alphaproteobacteria bacterium]|nr:hypothetical protein [Alphaproteobacteria bacterium]
MVSFLTIDGVACPVDDVAGATAWLRSELWLTALLFEGPPRMDAVALGGPDAKGRQLFRHGRNTVSRLGEEGLWVVCGPWPVAIDSVVADVCAHAAPIAWASVRRQWRVRPASLDAAAARLAGMIAREIPNFAGMAAARRDEI